MPSERLQRRIDQLLDAADEAVGRRTWVQVKELCEQVLTLDPENADAIALLSVAERGLRREGNGATEPGAVPEPMAPLPAAFANGRYQVLGFLGEGGKKQVYRAHDTLLDRDVAFALMRIEGLDAAGRERVQREAQALGRLSSPFIVSVFDLGEDDARPFIVSEYLPGGDLDQLIADAPDHRLPLARVLDLGAGIAKGLAFAHERGVVHRDLKPGNVLLAADGTPKLGDFGLAVALNQSRLTRAGMMVGTAAYMAPEQALGGAVTPQSDLYSLGCLLYELVCGRPPFVGDGSVALIGQHLHSTPVVPSWSRPDCPKALEALILRLLEKEPAKRPASAQQVAEALGAISPSASRSSSETRPAAAPAGPSPMYRRSFVGREQELGRLEAACDAAISGQGGLVLVVGEPGIGKTTLTEQLATYATLRGGRTLVGHCYEEGSLSLPYLPFVEALRGYVLEREPERLRSELASNAPDVARLVSAVRERVQVEPAPPSSDPGEDRYRLFSGVAGFLRNAAAVQPLVLVLEDLHDADRGTLELLAFLARQLAGARLLVVGTYRDVEVDRQHPLSAALADLQRAGSFDRVLLRGLTPDAVQRMLAAIAGQEVPARLAEAVHRQTEGNPLFVQEVLRYLAEAGLVQREGGRWRASDAEALLSSIPEGLRDVIGRRLSRLSPPCNRLLAVAAVVGREFDYETVQRVSGEEDEPLAAALEEAVRVAVLEDQSRGGRLHYRFAHAFFRQTLYEEIFAARRIRLHQQVARALEQQYATRLEEHAAELADHFAQSSDAADLTQAVRYGRLAAQRASAVFAHGEAERLLAQAIEVQEVLDPDDRAALCDLLLALGNAITFSSEPKRAVDEVAPRAFALAEALGDDDRAAAAALLAMHALETYAAAAAVALPEYQRWVERLDRAAREGTPTRAEADVGLFSVNNINGASLKGWEYGQRGLALARTLGDTALLSLVVGFLVVHPGDVRYYPERLRLLDEFVDRPEVTETAGSATGSMYFMGGAYLAFDYGQRERFEALSRRYLQSQERSRSPQLQSNVAFSDALYALLDGRLDEAVERGYEVQRLALLSGAPLYGQSYGTWVLWRPLLYLGRYEELLQTAAAASFPWLQLVCLAQTGQLEEARTGLRSMPRVEQVLRGDEDTRAGLTAQLEAAVLVGDSELVAALAERLQPLADLASWYFPESCPGRHLGAAAALLGRREQAFAYYRRALAVAEKVRFRPEVALIRLQTAELLAEGDEAEQREAQAHLSFVLPELAAMCMQPALERARRLTLFSLPGAGRDDPEVLSSGGSDERAEAGRHDVAPAAAGAAAAAMASAEATAAAAAMAPAAGTALPAAGQVFISYASADRLRALALAQQLEAAGISVWLDRRSIAGGSSWDEEIVRGIKASAAVVVLCSPKAMASDNVRQELRLALQYRKPLLPLLLEPTDYPEAVEYALAGRQYIELLERPEEEWLPEVLAALARLGGA